MSSGSLARDCPCAIGIQLPRPRDPAMAGVRTSSDRRRRVPGGSDLGGGALRRRPEGARLVGIIDMNGVQLASSTADAVPLEPIVASGGPSTGR